MTRGRLYRDDQKSRSDDVEGETHVWDISITKEHDTGLNAHVVELRHAIFEHYASLSVYLGRIGVPLS